MSALSIFNFEDNIIRSLYIADVPWFVAIDVANALGYTNSRKAIIDHCKRAKSLKDIDVTNRYVQQNQELMGLDPKTKIIPEPDLYRLVAKSTLPAAEKFESWIFEDVLPTIRKTGQYSIQAKLTTAHTWEQQRQAGKAVRADFTGTLKDHGVKGFGFAQCTNGIYKPLFGATASQLKDQLGLDKKASLRDSMSGEELIASAFAEIVASQRIDANDDQGNSPCYKTCKASGEDVSGLLVKKLK